ncbi:MAG: DUF2520 domain-containing protein [Bacteroidales bacterium]|jgi:predicted short-subunit dehydrogenase-like oxidoreductase (DUF2520 family)|nr:DUF2520 domain-containing protein [Bacteroidales bacterium]
MIKSIGIIGSGNVASWFGFTLHQCGFSVTQVCSRNRETASQLAARIGDAEVITDITHLRSDSSLYLFALPDDYYTVLLEKIPFIMPLAVHTAGSLSCRVFQQKATHYGVVYPYQTISKDLDFRTLEVPLCVEGDDEYTTSQLLQWAQTLSSMASVQTESQRFFLHLAAVFGSNFTNAMYHIAYDLLAQNQIDPKVMMPLLRQTLAKIGSMLPAEAQTGPAARGDQQTLNKHLEALDNKRLREIYLAVSQYIKLNINH